MTQPLLKSEKTSWASRRTVLKMGTSIGAIGIVGLSQSCSETDLKSGAPEARATHLSLYLSITPQDRFVFLCPATEIGQGVTTSLPQILAEDLGADWSTIDVVVAGADNALSNPGKNRQSVGQSYSVRGYYAALRQLGAGARHCLLLAAARALDVDAELLEIKGGAIVDAASGASVRLSAIAAAASAIAPPGNLPTTGVAGKRAIGRNLPRKDVPEKVAGTAQFASDISLPNMVHAALSYAPMGGDFSGLDIAAIAADPGLIDAILLTDGPRPALAILAHRWWSADQAMRTAMATLTPRGASSEALKTQIKDALNGPGLAALEPKADMPANWTLEADYAVPYLAHATMEPMSAVADVTAEGCTLYAGAQSQTAAQAAVAKALNISEGSVKIETTYGGGGFGRRWLTDFAIHAAILSKRAGRPVKLLYSREADMNGDYYRPACAARMKAKLDANGALTALDMKVSGQSILESGQPGRLKGRPDPTSVSGLKDQPYACTNTAVTWVAITADVPVGVWRSVGHSQNGFFLESFIDEAAKAAGKDPMAFRRAHLAAHPRLITVMEALSLNCCWGQDKPKNVGRGLAIGEAYGSFIAQVVEVEVLAEKVLKIHRVSCAFDCGTAIHPAGVQSQIESSIIFALSAALWGDTEIVNGMTQSDNFNTYEMLTLAQTPPIDVILVENADAPLGGAGEPGVPPLAPALANAIADATGERIRTLPLAASGWSLA